jgi:hypothetical protein
VFVVAIQLRRLLPTQWTVFKVTINRKWFIFKIKEYFYLSATDDDGELDSIIGGTPAAPGEFPFMVSDLTLNSR